MYTHARTHTGTDAQIGHLETKTQRITCTSALSSSRDTLFLISPSDICHPGGSNSGLCLQYICCHLSTHVLSAHCNSPAIVVCRMLLRPAAMGLKEFMSGLYGRTSSSAARSPNLAPAKMYGMCVYLTVCMCMYEQRCTQAESGAGEMYGMCVYLTVGVYM